jgi:hypothetical protein
MELTLTQKNLLSHALTGLPFGTKKKCYRNHYQADEGHHSWNDLLCLQNLGMLSYEKIHGKGCFFVTKGGAKAIHRRLPKS